MLNLRKPRAAKPVPVYPVRDSDEYRRRVDKFAAEVILRLEEERDVLDVQRKPRRGKHRLEPDIPCQDIVVQISLPCWIEPRNVFAQVTPKLKRFSDIHSPHLCDVEPDQLEVIFWRSAPQPAGSWS